MSQCEKSENQSKDSQIADEEENTNAIEDAENKEDSVRNEKEECKEISTEEPEEIFQTKSSGRIKSVKSDLGLLIINENDKKLNEITEESEVENKSKSDNGQEEEESVPPALPPRPPPRPRQPCTCSCELDEGYERVERMVPRSCWSSGLRKYVFLCTACGSLSVLLGALFLTVYFMLKSYTSSLNHFETIPTYVPSGMLIATGFLIICLACRKNRNSFLMKLCGLCSICCAVLCVSVTVTTTVIHMNRLQTLRECLYTQKTQSCTCYSVLMDNDRISDEGIKFVFNSTPDCEVIHGALYSCLRAIFGLSVIGILICIFSCMLVYQLLSHEKKKMYWAQLEMRCRYLYRQQRNPHYYSCCDECRYPPHPHELFPWELMGNRFWSTGRIGNLYTPNPEDRGSHNRLRSGWNWRRLPWSRSGGNGGNEPTRTNLGSPDSQYGFSSTPTVDGAPYTVLDPRTSAGVSGCHAGLSTTADITEGGFYSWGPPPPYASNRNSSNNSPARRSFGDILQQVSPIRRNDNVSPVRTLHHVHRHHVHHSRQCSSSSRQMNANAQPDSLQKSTSTRSTPITNAIQQQQQQQALWSNSLSSVHRFQKVIQSKDNYENIYDSENLPQTNGFNTLPSLKKRNPTRVSDIFQNETSTAYFFSSAENLGCSTSNIDLETQNKNFPPRVFLTNSQPNTSRYISANTSCSQNYTTKSQSDLEVLGSPNKMQQIPNEGNTLVPGNRSLRSIERNTSLVKKFLVTCSPTKQKPRNTVNSQVYSTEKKENSLQTPRKNIGKKSGLTKELVETGNENIITFRYRVGIPRSPNIQNFNQINEKSPGSLSTNQDNNITESWTNEKPPEIEVSQGENHKVSKIIKYPTKDVELMQKHNSLIKEFNKNIDLNLQKKYRNNKTENRKSGGIENEGFQQAEDNPKDIKQQFGRTFHLELRRSGSYTHGNKGPVEVDVNEDYNSGNIKVNENESDVYFGDISNSSCYMSLQNDEPESLLYEDAMEERNTLPRFTSSGHSLLNKQNLKMIENENLGYSEIMQEYEAHSGNKHSDNGAYDRHRTDTFQHNYRYTPNNQFQEEKPEDLTCRKNQDLNPPGKNQKRSFNNNYDTTDNKVKYFTPINNCALQDHYRPPDSINSNDEQSSSSLTADSGISTGRSFMTNCFDSSYECRPKENEQSKNLDGRLNPNFEALNEKFSFNNKISNLDTLGDFSHPLFQKPKVLPRGNRCKESESRQRKKIELEESESGNDLDDSQNKRKRHYVPKLKTLETGEVSNQLLNTCSLTLTNESDSFLGEELLQFESLPKTPEELSAQIDETSRKSPKPLPRTSVLNKSSGDISSENNFSKISRYPQSKEKVNHFLAPDAQYEFQENFKGDAKQKISMKISGQNSVRTKPAVPARPLNLSQKTGKLDNINIQLRNESACPAPRRRQNDQENSEGKGDIEITTHSVNV